MRADKKAQIVAYMDSKKKYEREVVEEMVNDKFGSLVGIEEVIEDYYNPKEVHLSSYPNLDDKGKPLPNNLDNLKHFLGKTSYGMLCGKAIVDGEVFGSEQHRKLYIQLRDNGFGFTCTKDDLSDNIKFLCSEEGELLNRWLTGTWDGIDRVNLIWDVMKVTKDRDEEVNKFRFESFKKFLRAMVNLGLYHKGDDRNEIMVILQGKEGTGKTTLCRALVPKFVDAVSLYTEGEYDPDAKDCKIRSSQVLLYIVNEVDSLMDKKHSGSIKAGLTADSFFERAAYEREDTCYKKRCSFIGSTNRANFLPRGETNRRYLVLPCADYFDKLETNNDWVKQLYLQLIKEIEEDGALTYFEPKDIEFNARLNKAYSYLDTGELFLGDLEEGVNLVNSPKLYSIYRNYATINGYDKTKLTTEYGFEELLKGGYLSEHIKKVKLKGLFYYAVNMPSELTITDFIMERVDSIIHYEKRTLVDKSHVSRYRKYIQEKEEEIRKLKFLEEG